MLSVTIFHRQFTPSWRMSLLTILVIGLFVRLGFWQMDRAAQKQRLLQAHAHFATQAPLKWPAAGALPSPYQLLQVAGYFAPQTFLLDNQFQQHQWGFDVISPFFLDNGQILLIDRGWVAGDRARQHWPHIEHVIGRQTLQGYAYYPSAKNWTLGPIIEKKQPHLTVIERVDIDLIAHFLHKSIYPFIMRLDDHAEHGFGRAWPIVAMPPSRHYGYAVQWFAMACAILILYLVLNTHKTDPK